jgi:hypothetical protein
MIQSLFSGVYIHRIAYFGGSLSHRGHTHFRSTGRTTDNVVFKTLTQG